MLASGYTDVLGPEESFTFVPSASHDYLLPPTTTCCLPRLPAASHDYLLPPTTTCSLPRLPAASHDYLLPTPSPSLRLLRERPKTLYLGLLLRRADRTKGTINA